MTNILNKVADYYGHFKPSKPSEYLALQLARKLKDESAFRHYLGLFEHHSHEQILKAYQGCANDGQLSGAHFMAKLKALTT